MKYCIVIMDGASGQPVPERGNRTSLEIARTPNLDAMVKQGTVGLCHNVPAGLDPDSSVACMSIFGYDPVAYYSGRAPIEAVSMGIPIDPGDVLFRCNLVTVQDGTMRSHSAGSISTAETHELVKALNAALGNERVHIFPGVSYRSILKLKGAEETANAICTPPHDIPGKPIAGYLPHGPGSRTLIDLMALSEAVLKNHPVNKKRIASGELPATTIWLFWGSGKIQPMPAFSQVYGKNAAVTSAVNLLQGLGKMASMKLLEIKGVTDGLDNDYDAQAKGALASLKQYDMVIVHIESPDEAGHSGSVNEKVAAIEAIDSEVISQVRAYPGDLRVLVSPDHPTPVPTRIHNSDPVPFLLWGPGVTYNGAARLTESEAKRTGIVVSPGFTMMRKLLGVK